MADPCLQPTAKPAGQSLSRRLVHRESAILLERTHGLSEQPIVGTNPRHIRRDHRNRSLYTLGTFGEIDHGPASNCTFPWYSTAEDHH
jgi:hypothetical protein